MIYLNLPPLKTAYSLKYERLNDRTMCII